MCNISYFLTAFKAKRDREKGQMFDTCTWTQQRTVQNPRADI